jgi:gliding motility-associated lipoprotein GldD
MTVFKRNIIVVVLLVFVLSCNHDYSPKPNGYMRIDFPAKEYRKFNDKFPYSFEYPEYGVVTTDTQKNAEPYWINIEFPKYNGKIHLSYKALHNNLAGYIEDTRKLAYKHAAKADAIDEQLLMNDTSRVYGILYSIKGNTASSVQFFVTDSVSNFIRGALYFNSKPNKDSLAPSIAFFRKDVERFIQTVKWR